MAIRAELQGFGAAGAWSGDRGPSPDQRRQIMPVLNRDGKNVTGIMNPGPDSVPLASVLVQAFHGRVGIEADGKDAGGKPVPVSSEGRLEDLGSHHPKLAGAWGEGAIKGAFQIARD